AGDEGSAEAQVVDGLPADADGRREQQYVGADEEVTLRRSVVPVEEVGPDDIADSARPEHGDPQTDAIREPVREGKLRIRKQAAVVADLGVRSTGLDVVDRDVVGRLDAREAGVL